MVNNYQLKGSWVYKPNIKVDDIITEDTSHKNFFQIKPIKKDRCNRSGIIFIKINKNIDCCKLIVVRGKNSKIWSFPKGTMNDDESEEECAIREVYEETGILINSLEGLKKCKFAGKNNYFIYYVKDESEFTFDIKDGIEVDKVEWKTIAELKNLDCNSDIRNILTYPEKTHFCHRIIFE